MKLKRIILCILALSILICACGCSSGEFERDGVVYNYRGGVYTIRAINDFNNPPAMSRIYILDEIENCKVTIAGANTPVSGWSMRISYSKTERIYFPWTIADVSDISWASEINATPIQYLISASTQVLLSKQDFGGKYVVPNTVYQKILNDEFRLNNDERSRFLSGNISWFFNYEKSPNQGYFFVDLLEESGKITKPPYDPKREGYTFAGWYKEPYCVNAWDFENDVVEIRFDEEGNRIYEEICLYAKWVEQ